jgi:hypothetical protein
MPAAVRHGAFVLAVPELFVENLKPTGYRVGDRLKFKLRSGFFLEPLAGDIGLELFARQDSEKTD